MDQKVVQKIGKYEIVAELGQGGMGVVYKARDPFIGRLVALKTITPELVSDPEILKRFYREAQSAGTLQHPNIVTIYDLGEADGRPYIAMEFVEGESLQSIINRRARIPLAAKLKLVQQFCEGLDHAHKHGFVHRDVKPANILVTNDGIVKVVDFGIVHLESTNLTKTGMFLGTIHYASPEQINDGRVDLRSDLWSVTCVVYEFIAYKKAFDGSNIAAIIAKVLSAEPEPLSRCCPGVPVELDTVISKGLKKNIEERYQSLDEMLGGLLPIARGLQQSFIGDLIQEAKDLRDKGDINGAQEKVRAVLILDNTHAEAKRLYGEVASELHRVAPIVKAKRLVGEAEQALSRGEYAEAARMLSEAQELNPADTQARNLKEKALREQNRVQGLREALTSGLKAMKQGDLTGAEQEFHQAIQLDPNNPQAAEYLEQIRQDRLSRERDFRLKEVVWETDNLISAGKYEEAQGRLLELQQDFPDSDEIARKLQSVDPLIRSRKLVQEGERDFNQGEYADAIRALTEALELNPQDRKASELKERALQERDRLRQVREALSAGQRAMRQGDSSAAEREFQKALQLDPTNSQATSLLDQIRQAQAAREREGQFREALQRSDHLVSEGKFDDAQRTLLELQQQFPDSTEIDQKLQALDQQMKLGRLLAEGQHAFDQGEFGEAVKVLSEAQELAPSDARVRDLKVRAVQERDRLRQIRDAISAGQRAMRQGDVGAAEHEFQRALQLDPNNTQAKNLLAQIQKERKGPEQDQRLKDGLSQVERHLSRKKFDEAQRKLTELQKAYPDDEEVKQKLQALSQRKAEAAAVAPAPVASVPADTASMPGAPLSEAAKSMQLAEELRRSLQTPRTSEPAPPAKPLAPELTPTMPIAAPPAQPTQVTEPPPAGPGAEAQGATMMLRSSFKAQAEVGPKAPEAPPPPPLPPMPPLPPVRLPQAQAPPPTPAPPHVEPKKPAPAPARVAPPPPVMVAKEAPKKSPMLMVVAGIALVAVLAVGGYFVFHHPTSPKEPVTPPTAVTTGKQNLEQQEKDLFNEAKNDQEAKRWDDAVAKYNKVADMNGTLKDQALAAINVVNQQKQNIDTSKIEKQMFQQATSAFKNHQYPKARGLFQQVIALKVPDSTLATQAQNQIDEIDQVLKAQEDFERAENAARNNEWDNALAQFQKIAEGGGPFAPRAKARIPELQKMKSDSEANAELARQLRDAEQAENNSDWPGALDKFKAVAAKGGSLGSEANKHIQEITAKMNAAAAKQKFDAAVQAQTAGRLDDALAQFNSLVSNPDFKDQAQSHIQEINAAKEKQADQAKFDDAVKRQNNNDLQGAQAAFRGLMSKPGPLQSQAADRFAQVTQLIADNNKTKVEPPPPNPNPPNPNPNPTPSPRSGSVTLIPSGEFQAWSGPVAKGQMMPDVAIEGGLKPIGTLTVPAMNVPANATVVFIINIDASGNVIPVRKTVDDYGIGPQVMAAAKNWKFNPPTVKGKQVMTTIQVKVTF